MRKVSMDDDNGQEHPTRFYKPKHDTIFAFSQMIVSQATMEPTRFYKSMKKHWAKG